MKQAQRDVRAATFALWITGLFGLLAAVICFMSREWASGAIYLIGAALAFGLMLNALLK